MSASSNRFRLLIITAHCALLTVHCLAWDADGHRAAAELAERLLHPAARAAAYELLGGEPLAAAANWADAVKGYPQYQWSRPLHYAFVPEGARRFDAGEHCPPEGCLVSAIAQYREKLLNSELPPPERAEALKLLIHLTADLHQPLRLGRLEDRGGAQLRVQLYGRTTDLMRIWDRELPEFSEPDWRKLADRLEREMQPGDLLQWRQETVEDWATESVLLARDFAYFDEQGRPIVSGGALNSAYCRHAAPVARAQLAKAGARLALLLNEIFGQGEFVPDRYPSVIAAEAARRAAAIPLTPLQQFQKLALRLPPGSLPAWLTVDHTAFSVSGIPASGVQGLIDADGRISPASQTFCISPLLLLRHNEPSQGTSNTSSQEQDAPFTRVLTARDFTTTHSLMDGWAPLPAVEWATSDSLNLQVELLTTTESLLLAQYTVENTSARPASGALLLLVRPLKLTGRFQPAKQIAAENVTSITQARFTEEGRRLTLDDARAIVCGAAPSLYLTGADFTNDAQERIARGEAADDETSDAGGLISAALRFELSLAPNQQWRMTLALPDAASSGSAFAALQAADFDFDLLRDELYFHWKDWTGDWYLETPEPQLATIIRSNLTALLLEPAEWLRHAEPLLQFGFVEPLREQMESARHENAEFADVMEPLLEPLSHYLNYTGDAEFVEAFWPRFSRRAQAIRDQMTTTTLLVRQYLELQQTLQLGIQLGHAADVEWIRDFSTVNEEGSFSTEKVSAMDTASSWSLPGEVFQTLREAQADFSNSREHREARAVLQLLRERDVWSKEPERSMLQYDSRRLVSHLRSLFVCESGNKLSLASGVPQEWIDAGVRVRKLHTWWGPVSYELSNKPGIGNVLVLTCKQQPPRGFVTPEGMQLFVITE